jgi:hypothetical protein
MPLYGVPQSGGNSSANLNLASIQPGDQYTLFNAETLTAPQASVAFTRGQGPFGENGVTFQMSFATAPTAVLVIQGSNVDLDAAYETLWTSTNTQYDNYTDTAKWAFYRAKLVSQSGGGACTVTARM